MLYPLGTIMCFFAVGSSFDALWQPNFRFGSRSTLHKRNTYPMNHAPLLARVPFCFQTRKWCPPAEKSVPVRVNAILRTCETFPTGPHEWEVVLSGQELLLLLVVPVSKIRVMLVAQVDAQTLFRKTDRPADREGQAGCQRLGRKGTNLEYV